MYSNNVLELFSNKILIETLYLLQLLHLAFLQSEHVGENL